MHHQNENENRFMQLQRILQRLDLQRLTQEEITYLQLRFMEALSRDDILRLTKIAPASITQFEKRFGEPGYHPLAKSTI